MQKASISRLALGQAIDMICVVALHIMASCLLAIRQRLQGQGEKYYRLLKRELDNLPEYHHAR